MDYHEMMQRLFQAARGSFDYTLTLLRVTGFTRGEDPLIMLQRECKHSPLNQEDQALGLWLERLLLVGDPLDLLCNLLRISSGQEFQSFPFRSLILGHGADSQLPAQTAKAEHLCELARSVGQDELARAVERCYLDHGFLYTIERARGPHKSSLSDAEVEHCRAFWVALTDIYFDKRLQFGVVNSFHKWPQFEVLEVLCDAPFGLYGFRVHFSNGSHAEFVRYSDRTTALNVIIGEDTINYFAGDLEVMLPEWRVGDKRLYHIGLPGRYNELGEWKPLVYPAPADHISAEVRESTANGDIRGALFYMICTGHRLIEFAVAASVDLPIEGPVQFGSVRHPLHLWKCPSPENQSSNIRVYDGWVNLQSGDTEEIAEAILAIGIALNRLAFAFNAKVSWRLKYTHRGNTSSGVAKPNKDDLSFFEKFTATMPYSIDFAIDWYNRGRQSDNPFTGLLCYFVAVEILVEAAHEGSTELGIERASTTKAERRVARTECIAKKFSELYSKDPRRFVEEAYFDCVLSLKRRRRDICTKVFGEGHPALATLFSKSAAGEPSLEDLRNEVAHGGMSHVDPTHVEIMSIRRSQMAQIAKEFIVRVTLRLPAGTPAPTWSGRHTLGMSMDDPRSMQISTTLDVFSRKDWSIRAEWCE